MATVKCLSADCNVMFCNTGCSSSADKGQVYCSKCRNKNYSIIPESVNDITYSITIAPTGKKMLSFFSKSNNNAFTWVIKKYTQIQSGGSSVDVTSKPRGEYIVDIFINGGNYKEKINL